MIFQLNLFIYYFIISINLFYSYKLQQNDAFSNWKIGQKSANGPQVENIKCKKDDNEEHFTALISIPMGFGTIPVFHDSSHINPTVSDSCLMKQTIAGGITFSMNIRDFDACGVQIQKASDGVHWMSVNVRFPYVGGLRMAEDEYVTIMCRPQERTVAKSHVIDLKSTIGRKWVPPYAFCMLGDSKMHMAEPISVLYNKNVRCNETFLYFSLNPPKTIFSSAPLDFDCGLELFMKSENDNSFSRQLPSDGVIEIGSDIQLRASVREGDGWRYAMLRDVVVHKIEGHQNTQMTNKKVTPSSSSLSYSNLESESHQKSNTINSFTFNKKSPNNRYGRSVDDRDARQIPETAFLVFSDGCRNPAFRNVAPQHPYRDTTNNLVANFNFKAFMFQDMDDGDTIRITAKVIACVDQHECQPSRCIDDDQHGYGRKKRSLQKNVTSDGSKSHGDFSRQLQFKVIIPGFSSTTVKAESGPYMNDREKHIIERKCRNIIYMIGSVSLLFCFITTVSASIVIYKSKQQKQK